MAELTVLRVEVADLGSKDTKSLSAGKSSTVNSLAAGAIGGTVAGNFNGEGGGGINNLISNSRGGTVEDMKERRRLALGRLRGALTAPSKNAGTTIFTPSERLKAIGGSSGSYLRNIPLPSYKQVTTGTAALATSAAAVYSVYSNYKQAGLEMSGATHAALKQARNGQKAQFAATLTAAAIVNPALALPVIAMKAYNLAQTNRKELFEMQKSQITSEILQRNLVKNVAERRF